MLGMVLVAPLQYTWTLFVGPLSEAHGWQLPAAQLGFTVFICAQTFVQIPAGFLLDRFGPTRVYLVAAVFVGLGWSGLGLVDSLPALFASCGVAGLGAGAIYGGSMSVALRWYSHNRGLALGLTAAAYGVGTALIFPFIPGLIEGRGPEAVLIAMGAVLAAGLLVVAVVVRYPPGALRRSRAVAVPSDGARPGPGPAQLVRTPQFWLMYAVFAAIGTGGLAVVANFKAFFGAYGLSTALLVTSLMVQQVANGLGRVVWGWVSDRIGRCPAMVVAFGINGLALILLPILGGTAGGVLVVAPLVLFTWGEAYALLPALLGDRFGTGHAGGNLGLLYSSKGVASLIGGALIAWLAATLGWTAAFGAAGVLALLAACGAYVLGRMAPLPAIDHVGVLRADGPVDFDVPL